ncbi:hypothetical protein, partial [Streptomyces sp. NPDC091416]|uniref:hypothetical protein n=1 Tax=Streptomyces sp. NPDC091416 TaxID=3366003 RepID=UPI00380B8878
MVSVEEWIQARIGLRLGQKLSGTVTAVPNPGATGIFIDIGLPVGGFVDVLLLPADAEHWPTVGTVAEFEVWWADARSQVRLKPVERKFLREDFDEWLAQWRPGWPESAGCGVPPVLSSLDGVTLGHRRRSGVRGSLG